MIYIWGDRHIPLSRWVDFMGHKYVLYSMQQSAVNTPWFVNYAKPRAVDRDCTERAAYLKQVSCLLIIDDSLFQIYAWMCVTVMKVLVVHFI